MAAPNLVNVATIIGKTAGQSVGTSATAIVTNAASSGKVFKVNTLILANILGTTAASVTVDVFKNNTTSFKIANTVVVPPDATLILISKDNPIYLEENDSIRCLAAATSTVQAICSYEEIS